MANFNKISSSSDILISERQHDNNRLPKAESLTTPSLKVPKVVQFKQTDIEQPPITSCTEELNFEPSDRKPHENLSQENLNPHLVSQIQIKPESSERELNFENLEKTIPYTKDHQIGFIADIDNQPTPNPKVTKFLEQSLEADNSEREKAKFSSGTKLKIPELDLYTYLPIELRSPDDSPEQMKTRDKEQVAEEFHDAQFSSSYSFDSQFNTRRKQADFSIKVAKVDQLEDQAVSAQFGKYEIPIYTIVCQPSPRPILEEAFFMNQMQLPEPNSHGHMLPEVRTSEYNSQTSKIIPGELNMKNSLINFDSNLSDEDETLKIKYISLSPSYRTPSTEGVYSTANILYYVGIIKHYELKSPETRIKIKQLASGLSIGDLVYFGYSELSFIFDSSQNAILAVDLKGNVQKILGLESKNIMTQAPMMRRVISPSIGPVFGYKRNIGERFFSPKKSTGFPDLHDSPGIKQQASFSLKEVLLVKVSGRRLEVVFGFDDSRSTNSQSAVKQDQRMKKITRNMRRTLVSEIEEIHSEIVDFYGYFVESSATDQFDDLINEETERNLQGQELRVYVLASSGWLGIYSLSIDADSMFQTVCIKEIELETGNKVLAKRLCISDPQIVGDWETEAGYSPYKNSVDEESGLGYNIIHERWSRIVSIQFESKPGSSKFKQSVFFFRLLPETYSLSLLFHYKLSSSQELKLDRVDENSPRKNVKSEKLIDNKILEMNLSFGGFFLLAFKTHLEIFSFRQEKGKVKMKKETQYVGQDGQFESCTFCPFEREDDQGRVWWVSKKGLLSSLEEGWGMKEWKHTQKISSY